MTETKAMSPDSSSATTGNVSGIGSTRMPYAPSAWHRSLLSTRSTTS